MKKGIINLIILIIFQNTLGYSQSNNCSNIPTLPTSTTCTPVVFVVKQNGTTNQEIDASCGTGTGFSDGWYRVVGTGNSILLHVRGTNLDYTLAVYTSCGSGEIACTMQTAGTAASLIFPTTNGTIYNVQIQRWSGSNNGDLFGNICAVSPPPVPSCSDGIQNQGETGVDCGGPCPACPPTLIPTVCATATHNMPSLSSLIFYDDGGPGGHPTDIGPVSIGNYRNSNCTTTTTICAPVGEFLIADFREFSMYNTVSGYDWMRIYDNNTTSGTLLFNNQSGGPDNPLGRNGIGTTTINPCSSGNCLTFEFFATAGTNRAGWDALVTAVAVPCVLPLPTELISFDAIRENNETVKISWQSASEINNSHYTVERSIDAINWEFLENVDGAGNSSSIIDYETYDLSPYKKTVSYYRLKQTDFNGSYEYSSIKAVRLENKGASIFPNPFNSSFIIQLPEETSYPINLDIHDYLGRIVHHQTINSKNTEITFNKTASAGSYTVKIYNDSSHETIRLLKSK